MTKCNGCGVDHEQELRDSLPEIALLDKAYEWARTKEQEEVFTEAVEFFCHVMVRNNQNKTIQKYEQEGLPPWEAVTRYAVLMMKTGFVLGAATGHAYRENIPEMFITDDEREAYVSEHWDDQKRGEEMHNGLLNVDREKVLETLKEAGIVPKDWDGEVEFVQIDPSALGGDEPTTGMYL
jgi:hypothetical protein